jgi:hypothetical protein
MWHVWGRIEVAVVIMHVRKSKKFKSGGLHVKHELVKRPKPADSQTGRDIRTVAEQGKGPYINEGRNTD